jgi:hypothetical protein
MVPLKGIVSESRLCNSRRQLASTQTVNKSLLDPLPSSFPGLNAALPPRGYNAPGTDKAVDEKMPAPMQPSYLAPARGDFR